MCFDYAMTDSDDYDEFTCLCDARDCRGVVRGTDWKLPELRSRYDGWFSSYIAGQLD